MISLCRKLACLALLLPACTAIAAEGGRAQLDAYLADPRAWSASFEQILSDGDGRLIERAEGRVVIARPGRFLWRYSSPYEQLIVADGENLWVYDVDLEQVTRRPLAESLGTSPAALLGESLDLEARYLITDAGTRDGLDWVELRPIADDEQYAGIRIGFAGDVPERMELDDALGQQLRLHLRDVRREADPDEEQFRFVPPPGVDVLDGSAQQDPP